MLPPHSTHQYPYSQLVILRNFNVSAVTFRAHAGALNGMGF